MTSTAILLISGLAAAYAFLRFLLILTHDPREPPALKTGLPFLSPLLGMRQKGAFYVSLRNKFNLPIYTLRLPFTRLYIINSTALIPAVQRQIRILDFAPLEARVAMTVMGASRAGRKILIRKQRDGTPDFSYEIRFNSAVHPTLTPGAKLDALNAGACAEVLGVVEGLAGEGRRLLGLFAWVKEAVTGVTTQAVYGPGNPFKARRVRDAYWRFEPGIIALLLDLYPWIFARETVKARRELVDAFSAYFSSRGHEKGSAFVKAHYAHKIEQGVRGRDIACFEIGAVVAILSNTIPAAFWVLYHTISDFRALEECRREIMCCCKIDEDVCTLDVTQLKTRCPVLLSILKESFRVHGIGTSVRVVMQDHVLDGRYLLKRGGIVMIPGVVQHTSQDAYGASVNEFQHRRFVRTPGRKGPPPVAWRGFGGGSTLCPGRHFASTEVLCFVALMVARFDFEPVGGEWVCPGTEKARMHGTVAPPDEDVEVWVTRREREVADKRWKVVVSAEDQGAELSFEDIR